MHTDAIISLSTLCLGIALAGIASVVGGDGNKHGRRYLCLVFGVFAGIAALPIVASFWPDIYVFYLPVVFVMILVLPALVSNFVVALTAGLVAPTIRRRDIALPLAGCGVVIGYWSLPFNAKTTMFVEGELPPGVTPAVLAFATFILIFFWLIASFGYLVATLRRLRTFRANLKALYSNTETRELRWVDWLMGFLVALWGAIAVFVASDNLGSDPLYPGELVFGFVACLLMFLIVFASRSASAAASEEPMMPNLPPEEKYARSALSPDHATLLAGRITSAMNNDALYLDPNLSLQKLSRHVGALPNQVSQTLNEMIGSTFFDFVAHWRIEASKPQILAGQDSVLSVALEVGFNSRSTFYTAFKRETGMTPKAYRAAHSPTDNLGSN